MDTKPQDTNVAAQQGEPPATPPVPQPPTLSDLFVIHLPRHITLTLAPISTAHYWRIRTKERPDVKPPKLPEGYDREQALKNVPQYKKAMDGYENELFREATIELVGAGRLALRDRSDVTDFIPERHLLLEWCERYAIPDFDLLKKPQEVGRWINELVYELSGDIGSLLNYYTWMSVKAGAVPQEMIDEALKSLRADGERSADSESGTGNRAEPASGKPDAEAGLQPAV